MNRYLITSSDNKLYSITGSYEFYRDYSATRENLEEMDWDIISVQLDYADINFIREFKDFIRWELVDIVTLDKWKQNNDPRYLEFKYELDDREITDRVLDDQWYVEQFVKKMMR